MGKTNLTAITPLKPDVHAGVVAALREALRDAKTGRIQAIGIAIAVRDPDGDGGRATETILSAADGWHHSLASAVNGLAFRLNYERYTQGSRLPPSEFEDTDE